MSEKWLEDLHRSAAVIEQAAPIIKNFFRDQDTAIVRVEGKDEEVCQILDKLNGIDYLILRQNTRSFGVAWRCQFVSGKAYNSFTIRKSRDGGAPTEYEKRIEAIKKKAIYPHYVIQAFVDKDTDEIKSLAMTTSEALFEFIDKENPEIQHTGKDKCGQAEFFVVYWIDMLMSGYDILIYTDEDGIA